MHFFLEPQCDQFAICSTKIRLPFSDLASTLNVENIRPKSTRNTKNLSPIFLQKKLKNLLLVVDELISELLYLNCFGS